jgi:hypothetical protein
MTSTDSTLNLYGAVNDIRSMGPELESAVQRFARRLRKIKTLGNQPRSSSGIRLPRLPRGHPVLPQLRLPRRLWTRIPATVLHKRRAPNAGLSGIGAELQAGVQHVADSIRARLLDLRKKLQTFHNDFARFAEIIHLATLFLGERRRL